MKIWIDLDNTPHVPFFKPIIRELEVRGHSVLLTARDAFQVCELAERLGLNCKSVGRHYGKNRVMKLAGLGWRSLQLLPFTAWNWPDLALSHGSRSQILLCNFLRIPTVMIMDYEHAQTPFLLRPRWEIVPEVLFNESLHCKAKERIRTYRGIKEDVYAPEFTPDGRLLAELGLDGSELLVTARPPATEAHYHNPEAEILFAEFMARAIRTPATRVVLLPRNKKQEEWLRSTWPQWFKNDRTIVPKHAVDGLNLLWHSDLVVSGGGTMNREAAALGIPVYSVFRGKLGAVDRQLEAEGRLVLVKTVEEVAGKILLERRARSAASEVGSRPALNDIIHRLEEVLRHERPAATFSPAAAKLTRG
ncbi:MAG TPA: DUF354 domain-containing protein [Verrucomicrobiae bacterium]|nr:DUF354 domain-containing protein [Verrucomicrobiae bacterium]